MSKLRIVSWNVKHFKGVPSRVNRVVDFLSDQNPDVFTLIEVKSSEVFDALTEKMPNYQFHITDGPQVQELLVGVKRSIAGAYFSQRTEFKSGNKSLRPGALLSLKKNNKTYTVLFLHAKSMTDPKGLGIRDDQFSKIKKLKKRLDEIAGGRGKANLVVIGDLNTMGMKYPYDHSISAATELRKLDRMLGGVTVQMNRLAKSEPLTYASESLRLQSDLDHVLVSNQLEVIPAGGHDVKVIGWPQEPTNTAKKRWIRSYSDHALLRVDIDV